MPCHLMISVHLKVVNNCPNTRFTRLGCTIYTSDSPKSGNEKFLEHQSFLPDDDSARLYIAEGTLS
jgi:hypothetical protein